MNAEITFSPVIIGAMRLGSWGANMDTPTLERFIDGCLELGITDFDHADIYGDYTTEAAFGEVLKKRADLRSKLQITTKCGIHQPSFNRPNIVYKSYDSSAAHIVQSVERSLRNLHRSHIDVLLLHRPDYLMNPQEVAEAFIQLERQGKVRAFGISNFSYRQMALLAAEVPLSTHQLELSLTNLTPFENGDLDYTYQLGMIPTAWSPFSGGRLFSADPDEQMQRILDQAVPLCQKYSCTLDQLVIAWLKKHPSNIVPIIGSSKIERVQSALTAAQIKISREDWYALWQASKGEIIA